MSKKLRYRVRLEAVSVAEYFDNMGEALRFAQDYSVACQTDDDGDGTVEPGKITIEPC